MKKKYKLTEWMACGEPEYGIDKRFCLFWYKPLCHTKIVRRKDGKNDFSYEILTFKSRFTAELEIGNLLKGGKPIRRRYYMSGKMVAESRYRP
jgi:hypothetical protein